MVRKFIDVGAVRAELDRVNEESQVLKRRQAALRQSRRRLKQMIEIGEEEKKASGKG